MVHEKPSEPNMTRKHISAALLDITTSLAKEIKKDEL